MNPTIKQTDEIKVIGLSTKTKLNESQDILGLWKQFMPRKHELKHIVSEEFIAIQIFNLQESGEPETEFDIWACVEVANFNAVPQSMKSFSIPSGTYAIFLHKGMDAGLTYQKIMTQWLPNSGYKIDNRPHFQIMGANYKNGSPDSEEDFYVPIQLLEE